MASTTTTTTTTSAAGAGGFEPRDMDAAPSAFVLSTGAAFPATKYTTEEMTEAFHAQRAAVGDTEYDRDFADRVFAACKYDRHAVALPKSRLFVSMKRSEYLEHRRTAMVDLAERACRQALERWGGDPSTVTHLYWGTMTGAMDSPTIDITLTKRLGLSLDVKRTSIEGMGCLTGFRLLNLANETALGNPRARILVVAADLRSALGNLLPHRVSRADMVSCALFRDAASASVVGGSQRLTGEVEPLYEIMSGMSRIVADSRDNVFYNELDDGFLKLHLSKDLPVTVATNEPAFVGALLEQAGETLKERETGEAKVPSLTDMDVACHTGGPRVLREVAKALGTTDDRLTASWSVMKANGNLSGASNLAVLDHQARLRGGREWIVCLSMGPGVCLEGLVMRRPGALHCTTSSPPASPPHAPLSA